MNQKRLNGEILGRLIVDFPEQTPIDRTTLNAWEYPRISDWVEPTSKRKLEIAGLWTEACLMMPVLSALTDGYEVYSRLFDPPGRRIAPRRHQQGTPCSLP
jgi:Isochorismatase family